ncbi:MAG: DNA starvation/stationary phase protection protein [Flavobacteriales bacterium]|nr:DNA starvation/stationary phase protection protein [Flavobacteriales bacterium]
MEKISLSEVHLNGDDQFMLKPENGISEKALKEINEGLHQLLGETLKLMNLSQMVHWNFRGNHFMSIHEFTQSQYENMFEAVDVIAERIRALGALVDGNITTLCANSKIEEIPKDLSSERMIAHLLRAHRQVIKTLRRLRTLASDHTDEGTVDLCVQRTLFHEKSAWILRSLIAK